MIITRARISKHFFVDATFHHPNKFSQLFSAEGVPESFNDFFLDFLQPKEYFGHKDKEFIELAQYFCFWLYAKKYTQSYLTLVNE